MVRTAEEKLRKMSDEDPKTTVFTSCLAVTYSLQSELRVSRLVLDRADVIMTFTVYTIFAIALMNHHVLYFDIPYGP